VARALLDVTGMRDHDSINEIDSRELNHVMGGMRQWAKSQDNSQLVLGLQTLQSSLDSLKSQPNNNNSALMMMLPLLAMRNRG